MALFSIQTGFCKPENQLLIVEWVFLFINFIRKDGYGYGD